MARLVGKSRAIELMATGETFGFDRAEALGIVNKVIEAESHEDFMSQSMDYARQITTPNKAAKAVGLIKRSVQSGAELPFESSLTLERELQQQLFQSQDAREGLDAYLEKRQAEFTGK